ncbi:MAG: polyribonucleotide nucleotidyltransferase [Actinobacteria bacterium]|nr:polyribonucleotide nucleotidyltransferase [Actinomycetota bacterium]|tara:strand:+ start:12860 stop:14971 length:2112 start_codon:yes stop_codon:yes gene_type:complete
MNESEFSVESVIANKSIQIKSGKMAKQANGSITLQVGNTIILATACMSKQPKEGIDFLPLTVEYTEKMYSAGKIPGGFFKREARPSTDETLIARLVDRPLRPSFPKGFHNDIQVIINVISHDPAVVTEPLTIIAASAALSVSDIPFNGPIGAVNVGYINNTFVFNPTADELSNSDLNLTIAGTKDAILMVEASANELTEEQLITAILDGHDYIKQSITLQEELQSKTKKEKITLPEPAKELKEYETKITEFLGNKISNGLTESNNKQEVEDTLKTIENNVNETFINDEKDNESIVSNVFNKIKKDQIRQTILEKRIRVDGRKPNEIRSIASEVSVLPSVHGSALFTRGETQSLGAITLGTNTDEMIVDGLGETKRKKYFFHYNFPPYSVGEVGMIRTSRRELGHGALAQKALEAVLPDLEKDFPYTLRIVSEILESNGSSSMASVCSGSLALMDCGVPIKAPVSGIAMGLLLDGDDYIILSDIQGLEDHYGDMDFKVAGTEKGITALQLDIKISGLSEKILKESLNQAKEGRLSILNKMKEVISRPNENLSENAPKIHTLSVNPDKVGTIIGSGGKMIRKLEEESGATITINDNNKGEVLIFSPNQTNLDKALKYITLLIKDPEVGETFTGKVTKTVAFGAFIEIAPGKEGLLHISKISSDHVKKVEDHLNVGDTINVKIAAIDNQNRINLERNKETAVETQI